MRRRSTTGMAIAPILALARLGGRWNSSPLVRAGKRNEANTIRCPATWSAARACPLPEGTRRGWQRGRCLVLDDSFEHEVVYDGDARRVVLIGRCWHPDVTPAEREFLAAPHGTCRGG